MTTTKLTRPEIIQDLLELYEGENPSTFADWLNAQTDCQLSVLWKNSFGGELRAKGVLPDYLAYE